MTCLSELVLALPDTPSASPSRVLAHCDPQNLHLLSASFSLDAHTERFLAKTTCLREVWLAPREGTTERDATRTHCVSETAASIANPVELSQLEVYAGDVDDALRLFGDGPRRNPNLRAMYLRSGTIDASNVHVLQTVSSSLEILELQTQLDPVSILELLSGCETLKGLRWLRIELGRVGRVGMVGFPLFFLFLVCRYYDRRGWVGTLLCFLSLFFFFFAFHPYQPFPSSSCSSLSSV
jgi:hypothetical protein